VSDQQLRRDIGQLLWIGFEGQTVPDPIRTAIAEEEIGAVILFARNIPGGEPHDLPALVELIRELRGTGAPVEPWIAVDQEGGRVQRVRAPATRWPPMLSFEHRYAAGDHTVEALEQLAEAVGYAMGSELAGLGFDIDFAPVLDVHTNRQNPIIGDRAFSHDPHRAARWALAWARGLERAGVIGCGKHFPGHGDTRTDSHLELPHLDHAPERLRAVELHPFRAAAATIPMIMTAHIVLNAIDPSAPATLSRPVLTELLRRELGYGGIIVSDDLDMHAIVNHMSVADAAVRAIAAGCDSLLLCRNRNHQEDARRALFDAARHSGGIGRRIAESAARIRAAKATHAARRRGRQHSGPSLCTHPDHRALAARLRGDQS